MNKFFSITGFNLFLKTIILILGNYKVSEIINFLQFIFKAKSIYEQKNANFWAKNETLLIKIKYGKFVMY